MRKLDPLRLNIEDHEEEVIERYSTMLQKVGLSTSRPIRSLLLGLLIISLLDSNRWSWRIGGEDAVLEEYWLFVSHVGDIDQELELFSNPDYVETAIEDTNCLVRLSDDARSSFVSTIICYAEFVENLKVNKVEDYALSITSFVLEDLLCRLSPHDFKRKAHMLGRLLAASRRGDSPLEMLRLALMCFPAITHRSANLYLYYLIRVLGVWRSPSVVRELHCPLDPSLLRVLRRIGMLRVRTNRTTYQGYLYRRVQDIARTLFPEDPTKLFILRYVGDSLCRSRRPSCEDCWLFGVCEYYLKEL
ncbi:MAG: hypothetical protein DRN15_01405 [Thermoprotei archaeon]|nr:MAG: hypothetical protein DRN15_01405 [Thermoprotei archaeon]RLF25851.1 MAG: hypothetical protein DRM97_00300 [Thermoprotei archaeon]